MAKLESLEKIRQRVRDEIALENVTGQSNGDTKKLFNAMAVVNESSMWNVLQWLHEVLLPKILQHRGEDNDEYKNFVKARDAIIWAMYILDAHEKLLLQVSNDRFLLQAYKDKMLFFENELLKYRTAEQLISDDTMRDYRAAIVQRALSLLDAKPKEVTKK